MAAHLSPDFLDAARVFLTACNSSSVAGGRHAELLLQDRYRITREQAAETLAKLKEKSK